jgi:hypothetical protein
MTYWSSPDRGLRVALAAALGLAATAHAACGDELKRPRVLQGSRQHVAYSAERSAIPFNQHFTLDVVACPLGSASAAKTLTIDALMPEHGHGMTYRPNAVPIAPGRWRVEGMLLHMRGNWVLSFDVGAGEDRERLTDSFLLK